MVFQNHKSRSFRVRRDVLQGSVLCSFLINDITASLPSFISCSLYADDLAIRFFSLSVPTAVEATQGTLIRLERWSDYWCLPINPSKCEVSFQWIPTKLISSSSSFIQLPLYFNPTSTFLGVTCDRTLSFSKHLSSLKAKLFPRLKALHCISAFSGGAAKKSVSENHQRRWETNSVQGL